MKKIASFLIVAVLTVGVHTHSYCQKGQPRQGNKEVRMERIKKLNSMKWAYITSELGLNDAEMSRIKPIFDRFEQEKINKMLNNRQNKQNKSIEELTESEAEAMLHDRMQTQEENAAHRQQYIKEIGTILSPKQTLQFIKIEQEWSRRVMERMKNRRNNMQRRR